MAAIALLLSGCATSPSMSDMSAEDIAGLFKPCVGPLSVHPKLRPLANTSAPDSIERIMLSDQGIVSDGYNHWLMVDREKSVAFIQEQGGFAGWQRVYGPLTLRMARYCD